MDLTSEGTPGGLPAEAGFDPRRARFRCDRLRFSEKLVRPLSKDFCGVAEYRSPEMGIGIGEGEAPSEPLLDLGSHGGSPSRGNSGSFLRDAVLRGSLET